MCCPLGRYLLRVIFLAMVMNLHQSIYTVSPRSLVTSCTHLPASWLGWGVYPVPHTKEKLDGLHRAESHDLSFICNMANIALWANWPLMKMNAHLARVELLASKFDILAKIYEKQILRNSTLPLLQWKYYKTEWEICFQIKQ